MSDLIDSSPSLDKSQMVLFSDAVLSRKGCIVIAGLDVHIAILLA